MSDKVLIHGLSIPSGAGNGSPSCPIQHSQVVDQQLFKNHDPSMFFRRSIESRQRRNHHRNRQRYTLRFVNELSQHKENASSTSRRVCSR